MMISLLRELQVEFIVVSGLVKNSDREGMCLDLLVCTSGNTLLYLYTPNVVLIEPFVDTANSISRENRKLNEGGRPFVLGDLEAC